jgi:hypothetical protein
MPLTIRQELQTLDASMLKTRVMAQVTVRKWMLQVWSTLSSCTIPSRMMQHMFELFP